MQNPKNPVLMACAYRPPILIQTRLLCSLGSASNKRKALSIFFVFVWACGCILFQSGDTALTALGFLIYINGGFRFARLQRF